MTHASASRRRRFLRKMSTFCAVAVLAAPMAACATPTFPFIPDHYTFSQRQVQAAVARKFPYRHSMSQLADVALANPVVGFAPDANRLTVHLDAHVASPFLQEPVDGTFTLSSRLEYDAAQRGRRAALAQRRQRGRARRCARVPAADRGRGRARGRALARRLSDLHLQARRTAIRGGIVRTRYNHDPYKRHTRSDRRKVMLDA